MRSHAIPANSRSMGLGWSQKSHVRPADSRPTIKGAKRNLRQAGRLAGGLSPDGEWHDWEGGDEGKSGCCVDLGDCVGQPQIPDSRVRLCGVLFPAPRCWVSVKRFWRDVAEFFHPDVPGYLIGVGRTVEMLVAGGWPSQTNPLVQVIIRVVGSDERIRTDQGRSLPSRFRYFEVIWGSSVRLCGRHPALSYVSGGEERSTRHW